MSRWEGSGLKQLTVNQLYKIEREDGDYLFGAAASGMRYIYARFLGVKTFFLFRAMSGWHLAIRPEEIDEFVFHPVSREKAAEAWEGGRLYEGQRVKI